MIYSVVSLFFRIVYLMILGRVILSWMARPGTPVYNIYGVLCQLTEPILAPCRQLLGRFGFNNMGLDFSPIAAILILSLLERLAWMLLKPF